MRTAFVPPAALRAAVTTGYEGYLLTLRHLYTTATQARWRLATEDIELFGEAFIGAVDSLHAELVYGTAEVFQRRRAALWKILGDSLRDTVASPP